MTSAMEMLAAEHEALAERCRSVAGSMYTIGSAVHLQMRSVLYDMAAALDHGAEALREWTDA